MYEDEDDQPSQFTEWDTVRIMHPGDYNVTCNSFQSVDGKCVNEKCGADLKDGECCDATVGRPDRLDHYEIVSIEWEHGHWEYNLQDDEGQRVWGVREEDLRVVRRAR